MEYGLILLLSRHRPVPLGGNINGLHLLHLKMFMIPVPTFFLPVPSERELDSGGRGGRRRGRSPAHHQRDGGAGVAQHLHRARVLHVL